jgi:hypothetical protein
MSLESRYGAPGCARGDDDGFSATSPASLWE